mgnify:CR=1 FL=1
MDLRTDRELDERGTFPVDAYPVTFHHLPVIDVTWDPNTGDESDPAEFLFHQYESPLAYGEPLFAKAFHLLGLPVRTAGGLPLRGRQGPHRHPRRADPVRPRRAPRRRDRGLRPVPQRHGPDARVGDGPQPRAGRGLGQRSSSHLAAEPEAMARLLAALTERHGSVRSYLISLGVSNALLTHLESSLLVEVDSAGRAGRWGLSGSAGTGWAARCRPLL